MRRICILLALLLVTSPIVIAESNEEKPLGWATSGGGFDDDILAGSVILSDNSVVSAGSFVTAASFGELGVGANGMLGDADVFIAISNESGNWTSLKSYGGSGADGIDAIALHDSGDIVVVGHYCLGTAGSPCEISFDDIVLTKADDLGEGDAFVGRFSVSSNTISPVWVRAFSNNLDLSGFDVLSSPNGGITVAVNHKGPLQVEEYLFFGDEGTSLAILHYNENGEIIWTNEISSSGGIEPFGGMCYSESGYLHIAATYTSSVMFEENHQSQGLADIFVAQIDGYGNFTWTSFAGGSDDDWVNDCAVDSNGVVHVVGQIEGNVDFDFLNLTSNGWRDMFHATLSTNGDWIDVMNSGAGGWETIESLIIDKRDNAIVVGTYTSSFTLGIDTLEDRDSNGDKRDIFVAQLGSNSQWDWAVSAGGNGDDTAISIIFGENESPIIGMQIQDVAQMGNFSLTSNGYSDIAIWNYARDQDLDGLTDGSDNCPRIPNPDQLDTDGDFYGDACDDDDDDDNVGDDWDDCNPGEIGWSSTPNTDHDGDGCRDVSEDFDDDEDGIMDSYDACPEGPIGWVSNLENDNNQDGCEDLDSDGDGFVDQLDKCPNINDDQADLDGDGIGDACESDTDGDGIIDALDNCLRDSFSWESNHDLDHDQDGCRDSDRDPDDDGDGVLDLFDNCPLGQINWNMTFDHDSDGCHDDLEDNDDDADNILDDSDGCPRGYVGIAGIGMDFDSDGCLDSTEDSDDDNDGILDSEDECRFSNPGDEVDSVGCSGNQLDDDGDGVNNLNDLCPSTNPGDIVSSTGCVIQSDEVEKKNSDEAESSLTTILFIIASILIVIALVVTFKPKKPIQNKKVPDVAEAENQTSDQ